jgi:predicted RNase H-like HicB family nuclease
MKTKKANTIHLPILIEQDEDNIYIVSCPAFKGCHSYGKTVDEALKNIKEVIGMCLEEENEKDKQTHFLNRFIGFRELQVSLKTASV